MTLARDIELPVPASVGTGILELARPLPDGWERGVTFATGVCLVAGRHQFCPELIASPGSPAEKTFQATDVAEFFPYGVEVSIECTTLSDTDYRRRQAAAALPLVAERQIGLAAATGTVEGGALNPSLADAVASGAEADAAAALGTLEDLIATNLSGQQAWVHVAPSDLVALVAAQAVYRDLSGWVTPGGHRVVASAGYTDLAGTLTATAEWFAGFGTPELMSTIDRADNTYMAVMEAPALAVFDPCFNVSVDITSP